MNLQFEINVKTSIVLICSYHIITPMGLKPIDADKKLSALHLVKHKLLWTSNVRS